MSHPFGPFTTIHHVQPQENNMDTEKTVPLGGIDPLSDRVARLEAAMEVAREEFEAADAPATLSDGFNLLNSRAAALTVIADALRTVGF